MSKRSRIKGPPKRERHRPAMAFPEPSSGDELLATKVADAIRRGGTDEIDDKFLFNAEIPEPSLVDRIAAIEDPEQAARIARIDGLIERKRKYLETLVGRVSTISKTIHANTKASKANWVLASPTIARQLDPTGEFSEEISENDL